MWKSNLRIPECASRESLGTTSLSSSNRFPLSSGAIWDKPVTLALGRARLETIACDKRITRRHNDQDRLGRLLLRGWLLCLK